MIKFNHYNTSDKKEAYSYLMYNTSTHYRRIDLVYNQVVLLQISCVILDSGRYKTSVAEKKFFFRYMNSNPLFYRYYIKDTLNYNLHEFLVGEDSYENLILKKEFCSIISIFNSELEKEIFE
ncbi:hypothetical protein GNF80_17470 [Clostridium perfringens]|nr:hypothetical protein [Clostridium perfringens]